MDPNQSAPGLIFNSRTQPRIKYLIAALIHALFVIGGVTLIVTEPESALVGFGMILLFGFLCWIAVRPLITMRNRWLVDAMGLTNLTTGARVTWDQVGDIRMIHPLAGLDELRIELLDARGKRLLTIPTDTLEDYGRGLTNALQEHLRPLYERKTWRFLKGEEHWSAPGVKDVLRIADGLVHVEFPKLKKQIIPLRTIHLVEWLPGPISGPNTPGFVRIVHDGGKVEVPQRTRGIQFFLFALRQMAKMGERVNPALPASAGVSLHDARRRQTSMAMFRVIGIMLILMPAYHLVRRAPEFIDQRGAQMRGEEVRATIASRLPKNKLQLTYELAGQQHSTQVQVRADRAHELEEAEELTIRVAPVQPRVVWFPQMVGFSNRGFLGMVALYGGMMLMGVILLLVGQRKQRRLTDELTKLEQASLPAPAVAPAVPVAADAEGGVEVAAANAGGGRRCSQCGGAIHREYYLQETETWCPTCQKQEATKPAKLSRKLKFRALLFGLLGGVVGGGLWSLTIIITGYELGLIAILVGLIIGYAVRYGAGNRGSKAGQVIAVVLTLYALAYSMMPVVMHQIVNDPKLSAMMRESLNEGMTDEAAAAEGLTPEQEGLLQRQLEAAMVADEAKTSATTQTVLTETIDFEALTSGTTITAQAAQEYAWELEEMGYGVQPTETSGTMRVVDAETSEGLAVADAETPDGTQGDLYRGNDVETALSGMPSALAFVIAVMLLIAVVVVGPLIIYALILVESPMSILFLIFALWEAWKINSAEARAFSGPFHEQPAISFERADFPDQ